MIYYDRIDFSEGNDFKKKNKSKECYVCHYWYFLNKIKDLNFKKMSATDAIIYQ